MRSGAGTLPPMEGRVCIVGAGAVGGLVGARFAAAGVPIAAIARGETLAALRAHGWRLETADGSVRTPAVATDDPCELGVQDVVVLAVKAPSLRAAAETVRPLLGPETVVVPAMNGVPWWFFDGFGGSYLEGRRLRAVDPDGAIAATIPAEHVVGCVAHVSASTIEPGLVHHRAGDGFILGEPDGSDSERLRAVVALFRGAGFDTTVSASIRTDVWYKLWGNLTMNPISALDGRVVGPHPRRRARERLLPVGDGGGRGDRSEDRLPDRPESG